MTQDSISEQEDIVRKIEKFLDISEGRSWQRGTDQWTQAGQALMKVRYLVALAELGKECLMRLVAMDKMGLVRTGKCLRHICLRVT